MKLIGVGQCRVCKEGKQLLKTHICPKCKAKEDESSR